MRTLGQSRVGSEGPCAISAHSGRADHDSVVQNPDGIARRSRAAEGGRAVVNDASRFDRACLAAHVIPGCRHGGLGRSCRAGSVCGHGSYGACAQQAQGTEQRGNDRSDSCTHWRHFTTTECLGDFHAAIIERRNHALGARVLGDVLAEHAVSIFTDHDVVALGHLGVVVLDDHLIARDLQVEVFPHTFGIECVWALAAIVHVLNNVFGTGFGLQAQSVLDVDGFCSLLLAGGDLDLE